MITNQRILSAMAAYQIAQETMDKRSKEIHEWINEQNFPCMDCITKFSRTDLVPANLKVSDSGFQYEIALVAGDYVVANYYIHIVRTAFLKVECTLELECYTGNKMP